MRKKWIVITIVVLGIASIAGAGWFQASKSADNVRTVVTERSSLQKEISFTGRLISSQEATLGFTSSGTVEEVLVQEGQGVAIGQALVRLDNRAESLQLADARAARASTQEEAYASWQKTQIDASNVEAENARIGEQKRQTVRNAKKELDQAKEVWQQKVRESGDESSIAKGAYSAVLTAQTAYNTAQSSLEITLKTIEKQNVTAQEAAEVARLQYVATTQAASSVAGLSSLEAKESLAQVALSKSVITAPFAGVVTTLDITEGELAVAGTPVLTVQTVTDLEITAEVLEGDVTSMTVGMPATVSFDALPASETWDAHVSYISPAATLVEGIPTYKVTLKIEAPDSRLLPGLTANVDVHVEEKQNVITVPRRAVITRENQEFVRIQGNDGFIEERRVTTGLVGSEGSVEITSGLSGGERVVTTGPTPTPGQ